MVIETMTFYPKKKEVLVATGSGRHISAEYEIVADEESEGKRIITLKKKDVTIQTTERKKLVDLLAEKLGESKSKMFRKLLDDTLLDYDPKRITKMIVSIEGGAQVKPSPRHCFRLYIGDGRKKKNSHCIEIRE